MNDMKNICTIVFFLGIAINVMAQQDVNISKPHLELQDNNIVISYNILNSTQKERFKIWIEATDSDGNTLNARVLSGHVGEDVPGGGSKQILWDYLSDNVSLEDGIYVQVLGELTSLPAVAEEEVAEEKIEEKEVTEEKPVVSQEQPKTSQGISMGGAMLRSAAFPGWGLMVMNPKKPHWIKGIAGYGAIASAVVFNKMAVKNYDQYLDSNDSEQFNSYYDKALMQDNISEISAYVAIGIWVTDLIWTAVGYSGNKNNYQARRRNEKFSVGADIEPLHGAPMIAFRYSF